MTAIKGVIFDCDGVLFESRQANLAYYNVVLDHFEVAPVLAEQRDRAHLCHTAASPLVFEGLLGPERVAEALQIAAGVDYRQFIPFMAPEPFMEEALSTLSARMPLAVATNRGTSMREILDHFGLTHYFQAVVTSRDVPRPKPFPDMLHRAASHLGQAEAALLFVGDSELDCLAAQAAAMPFVGYKSTGVGEQTVSSHRDLVALVCEGRGGA